MAVTRTAGGPDPRDRPARLTVGVVGVGRAGGALAAALQAAGHRIRAVAAVSEASRARAEQLLPGVPVLPVPEVVTGSQLVLLAVPDDALAGLVSGLVATHAVSPGQLLVHTSGAHGLAVLDPATAVGALPLALHPIMTFTGTAVDPARIAGCSFGVTAPESLRTVAEALVVEMGGEPVWVREEDRVVYHAALAHAANHLVTLVASSMELLADIGVERPGHVMGPLLGAALDNVLRSGDAALTGPVARGDAGTVAAHVRALAARSPGVLRAYVVMAGLTADRAVAVGRLRPEQAAQVRAALAGTVGGSADPSAEPEGPPS